MTKQLWKKPKTYLILLTVSVGILILELLAITILDKMGKSETINDNIAEGILLLICIPGILVGITGAIICAVRKNRRQVG